MRAEAALLLAEWQAWVSANASKVSWFPGVDADHRLSAAAYLSFLVLSLFVGWLFFFFPVLLLKMVLSDQNSLHVSAVGVEM